MFMTELIREFLFDCKVRELSQRTTHGYEKQLGQFRWFIRENCDVLELEQLKPIHITGNCGVALINSLQDIGALQPL